MNNPEYIRAKWEKERLENLQRAIEMTESYKGIDEDAASWWAAKAEELKNKKYQ